jgi:hypothetical protein
LLDQDAGETRRFSFHFEYYGAPRKIAKTKYNQTSIFLLFLGDFNYLHYFYDPLAAKNRTKP